MRTKAESLGRTEVEAAARALVAQTLAENYVGLPLE